MSSSVHRVESRIMNRKVELLIPAGYMEGLKTAIHYGADAIYMGGEAFSLRANAKNFSLEKMKEAVDYAHERGVKVYVTANILAHNADLLPMREYFSELKEVGMDAVLIADPGAFLLAKEMMPGVEIHISTQANNTNYETFRFWHQLGVKRVVCARELSLAEIKEIRDHIPEDMEIEAFVHGAMCMSYSGRCLLSSFFTGRDANQGACTHPCRWKYSLMEEKRPGEYYPVFENDRGTYIFNSKDLNMISHIPDLIEAGVDSLKIEGRMKTELYVATVARTYKVAIQDYLEDPKKYEEKLPIYEEEIRKCTFRDYSTGFYYGRPDEEDQIYGNNSYSAGAIYLGTVEKVEGEFAFLQQKNKFSVGESISIMKPNGDNLDTEVLSMEDADTGESLESCPHSKQNLKIRFSVLPEAQDVLRRIEDK